MKKISLLIAFVASAAVVQAQFIEKGAIVGTGSAWLNFDSDPDSEYRSTDFDLNAWAGFFVIDNLAIGPELSFYTSSYKINDDAESVSSTGFAAGPLVRYYLPVGVFFQGDAVFGVGTNSSDQNFNSFRFGIGAGYACKIGDSAFLEPMIGFRRSAFNYDGDADTDKNFNIYLGASFTIRLKQ